SCVVPSVSVAVTVSWAVAPIEASAVLAEVMVRPAGTRGPPPNLMLMGPTAPFTGTVKKSDLPEIVTPLITHVARARTWTPRKTGTLGTTQLPSGFTLTARLSTLRVQF